MSPSTKGREGKRPEPREWVDGINAWLDDEKKQQIRETGRKRAAELEAWKPGAGVDYLNKGLTPWRKTER